jgi:hypothetical protein
MSKKKTMAMAGREWTCQSCDKKQPSQDESLPSGWQILSVGLDTTPGAPSAVAINVCAECAKDPEVATKKYKATWT